MSLSLIGKIKRIYCCWTIELKQSTYQMHWVKSGSTCHCYALLLIGGSIKRCFCLTSNVCHVHVMHSQSVVIYKVEWHVQMFHCTAKHLYMPFFTKVIHMSTTFCIQKYVSRGRHVGLVIINYKALLATTGITVWSQFSNSKERIHVAKCITNSQ